MIVLNNIKVRNTPDQKLSMQNEDGVLLYDDHRYLRNRSAEDQHPISAITGLVPALNGKLDEEDLPEAVNIALAQAKASGEFNGEKGEKGDSDVIIMQAEGDAVKLTDSSERPFQELKVFLEETQTGVDSVGITVCGKNLLNTNLWRVPTSGSGLTVQYLADEDVFLMIGRAHV